MARSEEALSAAWETCMLAPWKHYEQTQNPSHCQDRERERSESKRRQLKAEERTVAIVIIICFLMSRLDGGCQCKSLHGARPASSPGRKTFHLSNYWGRITEYHTNYVNSPNPGAPRVTLK